MSLSDSEINDVISEILSETRWTEDRLTVEEFMNTFTSAQPIQIASQGKLDLSPADMLHPFLAFSRRRRTKVYAENLVWDDSANTYVRSGPLLEIPKDYLGWFEVEQKGWKKNHSCHQSVSDVAHTKCKQFLVRTTVIGHLSGGNNNDGEFHVGPEATIFPGELLDICDVITKKWKTQSVGGDKKSKNELSTKFLHCIDRQDRHVYLPFAHPGEFYPIWDSENKAKAPKPEFAYYIHDLIPYGFPMLVRVVFGLPPSDIPDFSGLLRLVGMSRPDTLVVRSLKHGNCVVMELPIDCDVKIEAMQNLQFLNSTKSFEKLLAHSCDRIYPYLIGMKHMDTYYPVIAVPPSADDDDNEQTRDQVSTNQSKETCRMARPRLMNHYDVMDIFPPLQEPTRQVADSWTLSFKDPDYVQKELREAESVIMDPHKLESGMEGIRLTEPVVPRRDLLLLRRARMTQEYIDREAEC